MGENTKSNNLIEYFKQNKTNLNLYLALLLPVFYFCISWMVDWPSLAPEGWIISLSYVFDVFFALSVLAFASKKNFIGQITRRTLIIRAVLILGVSMLCVTILYLSEMLKSPFKFLDNPFIQMLILAPIIEELVFRGAIYELFKNTKVKIWVNNLINSALFAFSHAYALFILPDEFHPFVYFQLKYTFVLGHLCAKSRERTHGVLEPIILHFIFNLVFYIAVHYHIL